MALLDQIFGGQCLVTQIEQGRDFEMNVFDAKTGEKKHSVKEKGDGPFDAHGRVSASVQHGRVVLLSKDKLHN